MWRAFVYGNKDFGMEELVKQSYSTFAPLDGKFDDNVILQVSYCIATCPAKSSVVHRYVSFERVVSANLCFRFGTLVAYRGSYDVRRSRTGRWTFKYGSHYILCLGH
jgi:alpha-glucuronidase